MNNNFKHKWSSSSTADIILLDNFIFKTNHTHTLKEHKQLSNKTYLEEEYKCGKVLICENCGCVFCGIPVDNYDPPAYTIYASYKEESEISCEELCIKDIIQ